MRLESEPLSYCRPEPEGRRCCPGPDSRPSPREPDKGFLSNDELRRGSWLLLHSLNNMSNHEKKALDTAARRTAYVSKLNEDLRITIPRVQYHLDSWEKEVQRSAIQNDLAATMARLYPVAYDDEAFTTVEHYLRSSEVTAAQRDAIALEHREAWDTMRAAQAQLKKLEDERQLRTQMRSHMKREAQFCKERYIQSMFPWGSST